MTKRILILFTFLLFMGAIAAPRIVHALTPIPLKEAVAQTTEGVPVEQLQQSPVDYVLAYPGILPDHPLYFVKQLRDSILDVLIVDPYKKIEFQVRQADKKLGMALLLYGKGKVSLAQSTLKEGEKSMEMAIDSAVQYKSEGKELPGFVTDMLRNASAKHEQVLGDVESQNKDSFPFSESLTTIRKLQQDLANIK